MDGNEEVAELRIANVRGFVVALQAIKAAKPQVHFSELAAQRKALSHGATVAIEEVASVQYHRLVHVN